MPHHFANKLEAAGHTLQRGDACLEMLAQNLRDVPRGMPIERDGSPDHLSLILDGWAIRSKTMLGGRRQTLAVLLPGDFANFDVVGPGCMDHDVIAITAVQIAEVEGAQLRRLMTSSPSAGLALWRHGLVDQAIQRSWIAGLGRRTALERLAHLLCELRVRLEWAGVQAAAGFVLPLTQTDLGDAIGMTAVHLNRTLQKLRAGNLIQLRSGLLKIIDAPAVEALAGFDRRYLVEPLTRLRVF
jgi:CRP-like cAMP-binding protein